MVSVAEATEEDWNRALIRADGALKLRKTPRGEVHLPLTTEDFRYRMDFLATAWETIRLKFPNNVILFGLGDDVWKLHVRFILGYNVWGKRVKTAEGKSCAPAWAQVLELECQIRHRAYKRASQRYISWKQAFGRCAGR